MDINSQQQVNTFVGGMNTDTSDALLESNQYRYAENLRLFTNTDSNSGELRLVDGTEIKKQFGEGYEILKLDKVRDIITIIAKAGGAWSVWLYKDPDDPKCLFGPCYTPIWENNKYPNLSTILNYESEDNIKLYIADGIHQIMTLKFSENPNFQQGSALLGNDIYKLLPKLNAALPKIDCFVRQQSGNIIGYRVQYFYRLYQQYGPTTSLSASSPVLSLYKNTQNGYETSSTGNSVKINIDLGVSFVNSTRFNRIQIFRIAYIQNGQQPKVDLICDSDISEFSNNGNNYIDDGTNIRNISVSEFLSYEKTETVPSQIEAKDNYLFASNLKYSQDQVDETFRTVGENIHQYFTNPTIAIGSTYRISGLIQDNRYQNQSYINISGQEVTYRPGETYRFGIIFYDNDGNKSSVFNLGDITIPEQRSLQNAYAIIDPVGNGEFDIKPINVNIKQIQYIPNCSKYEIVRCIRTLNDKYTISQGLLGRPMETFDYNNNSPKSLKKLTPSGFMTMNQFSVLSYPTGLQSSHLYGKLSNNILQFASPELIYQRDDFEDLIKRHSSDIKIHTVAEYMPSLNVEEEDLYPVASNTSLRGYQISVSGNLNDSNEYPLQLVRFTNNGLVDTYNVDWNVYHQYDYLKSNEAFLHYNYYIASPQSMLESSRNNVTRYLAFNIIFPHYHIDIPDSGTGALEDYKIQDTAYVDSVEWNDFANGDSIRFKDDIVNIDEYTYTKWSNPFLITYNCGSSTYVYNSLKNGNDYFGSGDGLYNSMVGRNALLPVGSSGISALFKIETPLNDNRYYKSDAAVDPLNQHTNDGFYNNPTTNSGWIKNYPVTGMGPYVITVADIRKSATPYGDGTNNTYCSFGDIFNNSAGDKIVSSGDCYIRLFKYNALHNWFDTTFVGANRMGTVYCVPIFTDIDLHGDYGITYNKNLTKGYYIQDKASAFDGYIQNRDAYLYNTAYNQHPDVIQYSKYDGTIVHPSKYGARVHYSAQKTNNELIDSWTNFQSMNFLDTDYRFGDITELKLFKDRLMFWQEHAFGIFAVNERVVLNDANDTQVVLGTGSVLDRYDYVSTVYGMKLGQHTACVSNDALYWWDSYNKEILQYVDKSSLTPLTQAKNIRNYINSNSENTHPHIYYNSKYKEVVCSCVNNQSVAYNELLQRFTSVYTSLVPVSSIPVNDQVYLAYMNSIYATKTNKGTVSSIFGVPAKPKLKCVVNHNNTLPKTFDIQIIGGTLYNSNSVSPNFNASGLANINITYTTQLNQTGEINGSKITNREYDFRLDVPRETQNALYGGRLKGKTMQCELWSTSNSTDFSLQYITTKYRMSWS